MKKTQNSTLYVCGCCKRSLPSEAFYIDKKTGRPGNYCKECRKSTSRKQRDADKNTIVVKRPSQYPVITRISDPVLRKELIMCALKTVAASIEKKKRKRQEVEFENESTD